MHINITKSETGNNKGSCAKLVTYLEKENRQGQDNNTTPEHWFNHERNDIMPYEVRIAIDNNVAKLSKEDAKFFLVNISPSEREIKHLKALYGEQGAKEQLKAYAIKVMDAYAANFKRAGVESGKDLVYFSKLENYRYYTHRDLEVRQGKAKKGDRKAGEQMHVQVIVSRKDASNSMKLSPLNNSRGSNAKHSQKVGQFDRVAFKQQTESLFDIMFEFDRKVSESFAYANALKNGDYAQREEAKAMNKIEVNTNQQTTGENLWQHAGTGDLLDALLKPIYATPTQDDEKQRRKKRTKGQGYRR